MQFDEPEHDNEKEKPANKGPVCYRRDLNAPKPDVGAEAATTKAVGASVTSSLPVGYIALAAVALIVLILVIYPIYNVRTVTKELAAEQQRHAIIKVVGAKSLDETILVVALLRMYGFQVAFADQVLSFKSQPSQEEVMELAMPKITLANGKKITANTLYKAIVHLKVVDFNAATPANANIPVILYGIQNCPYTAKAKKMLDNKGIHYVYVDLNADAGRYMGELGAKLLVSGYDIKERGYQPFLEYNNHAYSRSTIYNTISKMQVSQ